MLLILTTSVNLSKPKYFIFNQLIHFDVIVTLTFWHNSFASFFRFQKLSYFKGRTMYGFLRGTICITVSHILGMKIEVVFFPCSIAACIESHSICVWPGSRHFCSMMSVLGIVFMAYSYAEAMNLFLFWPIQVSENRMTCLNDDGSDRKYLMLHVPISQAPRPPFD